MFLTLYKYVTFLLAPLFSFILLDRERRARADGARIGEYKGVSARPRPKGFVVWVHAASVGESQAALRLIEDILIRYEKAHVLVTTGTLTSARLMEKKLPSRAMHQFAPLDRPDWVRAFLAHWRPDFSLWMESELWPNMVMQMHAADIPCALVNARLSARSAKRWMMVKASAKVLLSAFDAIFAQTNQDAQAFQALGGRNVYVSGNIKYSASPLPFSVKDAQALNAAIDGRRIWVYASTHAGEEALACRVHQQLKSTCPDVLTIIVPRHPERRTEVQLCAQKAGLSSVLRGEEKKLPAPDDDIYIADTLGELGLFYSISPIAVIGRSFSDDGGGGHNPIEAAQLGAAVLSGPHVRYQQEIFEQMEANNAVRIVQTPEGLVPAILQLWDDQKSLQQLQDNGKAFVEAKSEILTRMEDDLWPMMEGARNEDQNA